MSKSSVPAWLRARVAAQAGGRCGYCRTAEAITGAPLVIDHLIPEALGDRTEEANLWLACSQCNLHKGDRLTACDPLTEAWVRLFDPRRQVWDDHFRWSPSRDEILGLTPIGRATVQALNLNRLLLVQARRAWVAAGLHPPDER
jgi:hypothetical protein